jgi:two-component system sensor histidine kinase DegS
VDIVGEECDLDEATKIAIFRIIQESLNNIIKHAHATHANIYLRFEEQNVRIHVRDNGTGFDLDRIKQQRSTSRPCLGLAGMQERAALLDGTVNKATLHGFEEVKDDHTPVAGG